MQIYQACWSRNDYDDKFRLYMTSRIEKPHFLYELAAKYALIDLTVT